MSADLLFCHHVNACVLHLAEQGVHRVFAIVFCNGIFVLVERTHAEIAAGCGNECLMDGFLRLFIAADEREEEFAFAVDKHQFPVEVGFGIHQRAAERAIDGRKLLQHLCPLWERLNFLAVSTPQEVKTSSAWWSCPQQQWSSWS